MSCDATNALLIAGNFAGFGSLYRVSPVTLSATVINSVINQTYLGVGASPAGIVYVTIRDPNNGTNRHLSTVNTNSGALTDVGTLPQATFELVFRGSRLLGVTFSGGNDVLVEASVANASLTTIRTLRLP